MLHSEYREHVLRQIAARSHDNEFLKSLKEHEKAADIMWDLNLDPVLPVLESLYCPTKRRKPRDPDCMLRSLIVMAAHRKITGKTDWVGKTRDDSVVAVICGFEYAT